MAVRVPPKPLGAEQLAARVQLVVGDEVVGQGLVKATWSDDTTLTTRINPAVAHYTGQTELAVGDPGRARGQGGRRRATPRP